MNRDFYAGQGRSSEACHQATRAALPRWFVAACDWIAAQPPAVVEIAVAMAAFVIMGWAWRLA